MQYFKEVRRIMSIRTILLISSLISIGTSLIIKYYPINNVFNKMNGDVIPYIVFLLAIFVIIFYFLFLNLHRNKSVIIVDAYFIILMISLVIMNISFVIYSDSHDSRIILFFLVLFSLVTVIIIIRACITSKRIPYGSLIDFKNLYEGKIDLKGNKKFIIEEKEVDYDLLDRNVISNQLYETIQDVTPQSKFIIAIEGEWGSGKSTVLNLVKNRIKSNKLKNDCIIIDDFDPWHYNDERSMLKSMLESIVNSVKIGLLNRRTKTIIRNFVNSVFEKKGLTVFDDFPVLDDTFGYGNLIEIINSYLRNNRKKIVFFIDNIDRTQQEHVFFIYKSVASLIKIKHIIYVLAYDRKIVNRAFSKMDLDIKYLEKIIQIKYTVSLDTNNFNNVKIRALTNFYKFYGIDLIDTFDQSKILDMVENFSNLREFKLYINSLSLTFNAKKSYLNQNDLAKITIIQSQNPDLFNLIKSNYQFFITEGTMDDPSAYTKRIINASFLDEAKAFFEKSCKLDYWKKYSNILEDLFPVIGNYKRNVTDIYSHNLYDNVKSSLEKRVSNAKYFPLYFTDTLNQFIVIDQLADDFLDHLQSDNDDSNRLKFAESILNLDSYEQILFFENLYMQVERKPFRNMDRLLKFIICLIYHIDDIFQGFSNKLNARTRAVALISTILLQLDKVKFDLILASLVKNPKNLYFVRNIKYWLSPERKKIGNFDEIKHESIVSQYNSMLNEICKKKIDLYDSQHYSKYNARCLEFDLADSQTVKEYFKEIISQKNIFKYLYDYMKVSSGSKGYGYTIDLEKVYSIIPKERIEELLLNESTNEDDLFVKEVYEKSLGLSLDGFNTAILRSDSIELYKEKTFDKDCLQDS